MKTKLLTLCLFIFMICSHAYSQKLMEINTNNEACIHVIDGFIASPSDIVPAEQLAHYEQAASLENIEKLGFSNIQCVIVKSTADLDIENYIYRQVHDQVQQIGTQYKIPIAVNEILLAGLADRRKQLSKIKPEQVKKIKFLNKAEAKAKYGNKVVFGLIEIAV